MNDDQGGPMRSCTWPSDQALKPLSDATLIDWLESHNDLVLMGNEYGRWAVVPRLGHVSSEDFYPGIRKAIQAATERMA